MSEGAKNESEASSTAPVGAGSNSTQAASSSAVETLQSPLGQAQQIPTQQIMASPQQQQQQMMSPQQQQTNTPGPSPGGQPQGGANVPSPMNAMNPMMNNMSTINVPTMNSMMSHPMAGMTMTSMNAANFQQSMGHPQMASSSMPQVQVIPQQMPYLQQLYSNAQGQQFIMPGNIALQTAGVNQTIQVIATGKPFQPGQLAPSHLQIAGKNMIQGPQNDQNAGFLQFINNGRNQGYTIPSSNNQTVFIGPLINTQAGNFVQQGQPQQQQVQQIQQQQQPKPNELPKQQQQQQQQQPIFQIVNNAMPPKSPVMPGAAGNANKGNMIGQGVVNNASQATSLVSQTPVVTSQANHATPMQLGGPMQPMQIINPLQCAPMGQTFPQLPPGFTWATTPGMAGQPTLLAPNGPIFIRGPTGDGSMIFQAAPQQPTIAPQAPATPQPVVAAAAVKPRAETPKTPGQRPLSAILPSSSGTTTTPTPIRPASTVSTQPVSAGQVTVAQAGATRPAAKSKKVGRPPQNQPRPVAPIVQNQPVQPQQPAQQVQAMPQQLIAQQFQMPPQFQIQPFPQQQPQPTLMPLQAFQQMTQQTMDTNQQAQLQQQLNEQQQIQQFQMNKPILAVASSTSVTMSSVATTSTQNTQPSAPAPPSSQSQSSQSAPVSQPMATAPSVSMPFVSTVTTTQTVRSNYKPIAPAPPQQQNGEKTDPLQQVVTIPVGSAVNPIRYVTPMGNYQPVMGDQQPNMMQLSSSGQSSACFITSPAVTTVSRMGHTAGGMISTTTPLNAMASMTQTVPLSAVTQAVSNGPRLAIPPLLPVTVTVSSASGAPHFAVPSPRPPLASQEEKKDEGKKELENGHQENGHHSPTKVGDKKEPGLPQAVVRPQILTHVLGDFVIQESSEPFPVGRFPSNEPVVKSCNGHHETNGFKQEDEPPAKKLHMDDQPPTVTAAPLTPAKDVHQMSTPKGATMATCEGCGKMDFVSKFRRSKRFCSTACSKKPASHALSESCPPPSAPVNGHVTGLLATVTNPLTVVAVPTAITVATQPVSNGDKEADSNLDAELMALAAQQMRSPTAPQTPKLDVKPNIAKWTVTEVADFVRSLTGCADYAEEFAMQEIDGQALMLLKADHLMSAMSMKLGPALKICAKIDAMRGGGDGAPSANAGGEPTTPNRQTP